MEILPRIRPTIRTPRRAIPPRVSSTLIGCLAIPLWATWPMLAALTSAGMPLFQYLGIVFASGAAVLYLLPAAGTPSGADAPPAGLRGSRLAAAVMVGLGLLVSDILFLMSSRYIPVAQGNLILYLWPVMVVLLCIPAGLARVRATHAAGLALGFAGASAVIGWGGGAPSVTGVALAAGGGLAWAIYVVFRIWQGPQAPDALASGLALSAAALALLHAVFETTTLPAPGVLAGTVLVGILPLAIGNLVWDHGVRNGDKVLLATFAYATPLVSALLLSAFGLAALTPGLAVGAVLIVAAGIVASR